MSNTTQSINIYWNNTDTYDVSISEHKSKDVPSCSIIEYDYLQRN